MAEHSMTPWKVVPTNTYLFIQSAKDGTGYLAGFRGLKAPAGEREANARYTVAAVNECAALGLSAEALESGAVARLEKAASALWVEMGMDKDTRHLKLWNELADALAPFDHD